MRKIYLQTGVSPFLNADYSQMGSSYGFMSSPKALEVVVEAFEISCTRSCRRATCVAAVRVLYKVKQLVQIDHQLVTTTCLLHGIALFGCNQTALYARKSGRRAISILKTGALTLRVPIIRQDRASKMAISLLDSTKAVLSNVKSEARPSFYRPFELCMADLDSRKQHRS